VLPEVPMSQVTHCCHTILTCFLPLPRYDQEQHICRGEKDCSMAFSLSLLPKEDRFYDLISESGELSYLSVQLLKNLVVEGDPQKAYKLGRDLEIAKGRAKTVTHEITEKLCQTFITPLDREDIHALASGLYKIPKISEKAQERILAFNLKPFQNDFFKLTANMEEAAEHLQFLIQNLKTLKDSQAVHDKCALLNNVENNTDELLNQLLLELFEKESDVKQVILRKDVYNLMESIVDRHRDMGNLILEIVLKHS
jgi:uncharacterized protein